MSELAELAERRRIAHEVYMITGVLVPEDDVLVLAALFYSRKLQDAASEAAGQITSASTANRVVVDEAVKAIRQATATNNVLADAFEVRLQKGLRQVVQAQSRANGIILTTRHLFAAFAGGAAAVVLSVSFASGFSYSWMSDAALGRAFNRVSSDLDPALQAKILQQLKKKLSD